MGFETLDIAILRVLSSLFLFSRFLPISDKFHLFHIPLSSNRSIFLILPFRSVSHVQKRMTRAPPSVTPNAYETPYKRARAETKGRRTAHKLRVIYLRIRKAAATTSPCFPRLSCRRDGPIIFHRQCDDVRLHVPARKRALQSECFFVTIFFSFNLLRRGVHPRKMR